MAKQMVNPVERHLEKAVLGLAGLALVYVIVQYLITSPNQMELGNRTVTPSNIDAVVAERSEEILSRLRSAAPQVEVPPPLYGDFEAALAPLRPEPLAAVAPFQPVAPLIDPPIDVLGRAQLVEVLRPAAPKVTSGRSTISTTVQNRQVYVPVNWATPTVLLDYKAQVDRQKNAYGATQDAVLVYPLEVQRRRARADGSFSDGDWVDVKTWPVAPLPREPAIPIIQVRDAPTVAPNVLKDIETYTKSLAELPRQRDCLRPLMAPIINGTPWTFAILTSYLDVKKQDHQFLSPNEPAGASPLDLYEIEPTAAPQRRGPLTPEQEIEASLKEAETLILSARKNLSTEDAIRAHNIAAGIVQDRNTSSSLRTRAEDILRRADQAEKDVQRIKATDAGLARGGPADAAVPIKRDLLPIQQVWAHDAAQDSIKDKATYQYRVRFRIYNQFAGLPEKFDKPEDATKLILAGDWSPPSEPVTFEPVSLFFVTYEDKPKGEVGIEFFRWYYGVWLKSRRHKVGVGDELATEHRTPAPSLLDPEELDNPLVDFSAEGFVVDLDFGRKSQERKTGRGAGGVSFGQLRDDTAMVLLTEDGGLEERFVSLDRDHPDKREAAGKLWSPRSGR